MSTVAITNTSAYKVGNDQIVTCKVNQTWTAYFKSVSDIRATGNNEQEAIGNLIIGNSKVLKVA